MSQITRLPAVPVIVNDPYFSIWSAADRPTDRNTTHWAGEDKPLFADIHVDGCKKRLMGLGNEAAMPLTESTVTATATEFVYEDMGVRAKLKFVTPLLMDDPDVLSAPVTYVSLTAESMDGKEHEIITHFSASSQLTYSGAEGKPLIWDTFDTKGLKTAYVGRREQKPLSHSGDHITIDWGYLFLAGKDPVTAGEGGLSITGGANLECMIAYEDVASINYFGRLTPAWYARNGKNLVQMLTEMDARRAEILNRCRVLDEKIRSESLKIGGEDYALITAASYRQCLGAHKLIADENGEMVFLSKENDSNGCIGTVDVSYPSIPLMLLENPEFVKGLCRPILKFAEMPVWRYDFAPHDVGRYPNATGQVYAAKVRVHTPNGSTYPPYYLYPASSDPYHFAYQMPVEECGNMLIMLAAAWRADGDLSLVKRHMPTLEKWVRYLIDFGEDPGEQLCTDDFAGHLARNVNLSAKAVCGVAAFGLLKKALGEAETGEKYLALARELAASWEKRCDGGDHTFLTFDGNGWSMKYNMVWDKLFGLNLMDDDYYARENAWYKAHTNEFGLPLDSRSDYTKSDWIMWVAALAPAEDFSAYAAPIAHYIRNTVCRVAFSDWYDSKNGTYQHFIARSVQGGVFMPMLMRKWTEK